MSTISTDYANAQKATGELPLDGIELAGRASSGWTDDVDKRLLDYYRELGITDEQIQAEKQWELLAYKKAREAALVEMKRLGGKASLSSCRGLDRLMVTLTAELVIRYAIKAKRNKQNTADMAINSVINLALEGEPYYKPEWMRSAGEGQFKYEKTGLDTKAHREPAWVNLLSLGFLASTVVMDFAAVLLSEKGSEWLFEHQLAQEIGKRINREIQAIGWYRLDTSWTEQAANKLPPGTSPNHAFMKLTRQLQRKNESVRKARRISKTASAEDHPDLRLPTNEDYLRRWSLDECEKVGMTYVTLLCQAGYLETLGVKKPKGSNNFHSVITLTSSGKEAFGLMMDKGLTAAYQHVPMLIPPVPHSCRPKGTVAGRSVGGYLLDAYAQTHRKTISGSKLGHHTSKEIRESDSLEPGWIDELNAAQFVKMALNRDVYDVVVSLKQNGCPVSITGDGEIIHEPLSVHSLQLFSSPRHADLEQISNGYEEAIQLAKANGDEELELSLRREVRYRKKRIHEQALYDRGNAARIGTLLWTCEQLIKAGHQDNFYIPWFADGRRRFYGLGALNPIEREVSKGLLLHGQKVDFTNDSEMEAAVRKDLLWTLATCWGAKTDIDVKSDKLAPAERSTWAGEPEQLEKILQVGRNPLHPDSFAIWAGTKGSDHLGRTVIKGGGADPFMFLAACLEYVALFDAENPNRRTWTQLASGRDATGSGLQMAALSTCSRHDAIICNAAPHSDANNTRPQDVYTAIFVRGVQVSRENFFVGDGGENLLGDNRFDERLAEYGLRRNAAKPVGMIATYGGAAGTNEDDVLDILRDKQTPFIPRFLGLDERHDANLLELGVEEYQEYAAKRGQVLPVGLRTPRQLLDQIDVIRREDLELVADAKRRGLITKPSAMQLFRTESSAAPERPKREDSRYNQYLTPDKAEEAFQEDLRMYGLALRVHNQQAITRESRDDRALERVDIVVRYINVVRQMYGLKSLKRAPGEIKVYDVDPLIHTFVMAMRVALGDVVPTIVGLRDGIKSILHPKADDFWEGVARHGGGIQWDMPHGWQTRQVHLIDSGLDTVSKNRVHSMPKVAQWDRLSVMSTYLETLIDDDSIEDIEETLAIGIPETKRAKWRRLPDPVDVMRQVASEEVDKTKHRNAIVANFAHSCDAAFACELRRQLRLQGIDTTQVHDCFFVTLGYSEKLLQAARDAVKVLFGEAAGEGRPLDRFLKALGASDYVRIIRRPIDHEDYFDPAATADRLNNFIC